MQNDVQERALVRWNQNVNFWRVMNFARCCIYLSQIPHMFRKIQNVVTAGNLAAMIWFLTWQTFQANLISASCLGSDGGLSYFTPDVMMSSVCHSHWRGSSCLNQKALAEWYEMISPFCTHFLLVSQASEHGELSQLPNVFIFFLFSQMENIFLPSLCLVPSNKQIWIHFRSVYTLLFSCFCSG